MGTRASFSLGDTPTVGDSIPQWALEERSPLLDCISWDLSPEAGSWGLTRNPEVLLSPGKKTLPLGTGDEVALCSWLQQSSGERLPHWDGSGVGAVVLIQIPPTFTL